MVDENSEIGQSNPGKKAQEKMIKFVTPFGGKAKLGIFTRRDNETSTPLQDTSKKNMEAQSQESE